jgi:hypothetical protein
MLLTMGDSYTIVTPPAEDETRSLITSEDPRQVITAEDPATRRTRAALKMFRDDWDAADWAYLYLPGDGVYRMRHEGPSTLTATSYRMDAKGWVIEGGSPQPVPGGVVPVVHWRNRDGMGEFERHLDTLDRINDKIFDEWWTAKVQAFRQRAVKNLPDTLNEVQEDGSVKEVPVPEDAYDGMFTASPDEMWQVPGDVEFWESTPVDLTPITNSIEKDRQRLASVTSTPLHTVTPDAANGSAEGASLMREEHVSKIDNRLMRVRGAAAQTMRLAFLFQGDTARADITKLEPIWGPVERFSLGERAAAAAQAKDSLPREAIQRDVWQYPPAEIPELRKMQGRDLIFLPPPATLTPQAPGGQPDAR